MVLSLSSDLWDAVAPAPKDFLCLHVVYAAASIFGERSACEESSLRAPGNPPRSSGAEKQERQTSPQVVLTLRSEGQAHRPSGDGYLTAIESHTIFNVVVDDEVKFFIGETVMLG